MKKIMIVNVDESLTKIVIDYSPSGYELRFPPCNDGHVITALREKPSLVILAGGDCKWLTRICGVIREHTGVPIFIVTHTPMLVDAQRPNVPSVFFFDALSPSLLPEWFSLGDLGREVQRQT